jgi:hypothetical protein
MFPYVVYSFGGVSFGLACIGGYFVCKKALKEKFSIEKKVRVSGKKEKISWFIFGVLVALQILAAAFLTYGDGDDAFYVAVSTITEASDTLYKIMPYSMGETGLDLRHGLAPFPIWIAFLARVSGFSVPFVAHVAANTFLIGMTYVIFGKIAQVLWGNEGEKRSLFLCLVALLVLFGDYSYKTPENFMIARSRQGKAALGNIIIPIIVWLLLMIFKQLQEKQKVQLMLWVILCATVISACLCSTLGTFLTCLMLGMAGICAGVVYRNIRLVIQMAICCIPSLIFALLYIRLG